MRWEIEAERALFCSYAVSEHKYVVQNTQIVGGKYDNTTMGSIWFFRVNYPEYEQNSLT